MERRSEIGISRTLSHPLAAMATAAASAISAGWLVANHHLHALLMVLGAVTFCLLALRYRGLALGVLVLATMNGLPFFNTYYHVAGGLEFSDMAGMLLVITAFTWTLMDNGWTGTSTAARRISIFGLFLLAWCGVVIAWTILLEAVPSLKALSFGRDFLFFAALVTLLPRVRLTPRDIRSFVAVLGGATAIFAAGQIAIAINIGHFGALIHYKYLLSEHGITRVYAFMTDLVSLGLCMGVAGLVLARNRSLQVLSALIFSLCLVSTAVQLTRARWLGIVLGLLFVTLLLLLAAGPTVRARLRGRAVAALFPIVGLVLFFGLIEGHFALSGLLFERLSSATTDLQTGAGTIGIRETVVSNMLSILGSSWLLGLGFIPPAAHYFATLPEGSIRNTDVGLFNGLMTMGVLGTVLLYIPVLGTLAYSLRQLIAGGSRDNWFLYGASAWLLSTVLTSITLVTLFSVSGLTLTATVIGVLLNPAISDNGPNDNNQSAPVFDR